MDRVPAAVGIDQPRRRGATGDEHGIGRDPGAICQVNSAHMAGFDPRLGTDADSQGRAIPHRQRGIRRGRRVGWHRVAGGQPTGAEAGRQRRLDHSEGGPVDERGLELGHRSAEVFDLAANRIGIGVEQQQAGGQWWHGEIGDASPRDRYRSSESR